MKKQDKKPTDKLKPEIAVNGDLITVTIKFKSDKNGGTLLLFLF